MDDVVAGAARRVHAARRLWGEAAVGQSCASAGLAAAHGGAHSTLISNLCVQKKVVRKLTESRFGISKFGIPIEIWSLMSAGIGCNSFLVGRERHAELVQ